MNDLRTIEELMTAAEQLNGPIHIITPSGVFEITVERLPLHPDLDLNKAPDHCVCEDVAG